MEGIENPTFQDSGEADDSLSLRDLTISDNYRNSSHSSPRTSSAQSEPFEFVAGKPASPSTKNDVVFCGKIIPYESSSLSEDDQLNEYQKRDYLSLTKSTSLRKPDHVYDNFNDDRDHFVTNARSNSGRFSGSEPHPVPKCTYSVQKVNITSLTSMSAKSRRRMFMFGPVKFKPEMELSAIRERQGRRVPAPMFPAAVGVETATDGGEGGKGEPDTVDMSCRPHLTGVLARSFGCIPLT